MERKTERKIELQQVFVTNGVPKYTFVKSKEYKQLLVALKTPGRGIVLEGPSGIGKTSAFIGALEEIPEKHKVLTLSARKQEDIKLIEELPNLKPFGFVIIDDFHKLEDALKQKIADLMKVIADENDNKNKIVIAGINKAGINLVSFASDLNNRIEIIPFESNPDEKIEELISLGEKILNIEIGIKEDIIKSSQGSFYLAQMLCFNLCIEKNILEEQSQLTKVVTSFELIKSKVFENLYRRFNEVTIKFVQGNRLYREGRAPYLHLLHWLALEEDWVLNLNKTIAQHDEFKGSISQITTKGYLKQLIEGNKDLRELIFYQERNNTLVIQDPQYVYFLRNLSWQKLSKDAGYVSSMDFKTKYDFALSFAGSDRDVAEGLYNELAKLHFEIFYDKNEQYRILAEDVEDYLRPIYQSEALFVIVLLTRDYPERIWTKIESESFKNRLTDGSVIPIVFSDYNLNYSDKMSKIGHLSFDRNGEFTLQIDQICIELKKKIHDQRINC
jgi:hypothetical protein